MIRTLPLDAVAIDLTPGTEYDYAPTTWREVDGEKVAGRWRLGRYRVLGTAWEARTRQELVVYAGQGGPDDGKWYVCTLYDFALRFLHPEPEPAEAAALPSPKPNPLLERAQQAADMAGEDVLLIVEHHPGPMGQREAAPTPWGPRPYTVPVSVADAWEMRHAVMTVSPRAT